jgi:PAS domain S-box-containing protein
MLEKIADSDVFQRVCDAIQDAVFILDLDLTIVQANSTMKRWFGQQSPLRGQKCYRAIWDRSEPCNDCPCLRALKVQTRQAEMIHKRDIHGITRWYDVYAFPLLNTKNQVVGIVNHIRDATLRAKAERQQLEATATLARAEKLSSLAALTAGITHELTQPLNAIKVLADSMLFWFKRGRIPETDEMVAKLKDISEQTDRADQIIHHVRSIIHGDREVGSKTRCDLNEVVTNALHLVASQLQAHGITVEKNLIAGLPAVRGDKIQLEQAIINLLINAMQSLDQSGHADKKVTIEDPAPTK